MNRFVNKYFGSYLQVDLLKLMSVYFETYFVSIYSRHWELVTESKPQFVKIFFFNSNRT